MKSKNKDQFRTVFEPVEADRKITHMESVFFIGSCFSTHISARMKNAGFQITANPFGVLFNPVSVSRALRMIGTRKKFRKQDFFRHDGLWHHFHLHGELSKTDLESAYSSANEMIENSNSALMSAGTLVITLGTAWVHEEIDTERIVANCHKLPGKQFRKRKLGVNEIISDFSRLLEHLFNVNPGIRIVFTISPVRHLSDGFVENQWSKSTLNIAIHELIRRFEQTEYFPAYELIIDDLRDYRFYNSDMIHPNDQAADYVWDIFRKTYFEENTNKLASEAEAYHLSMQHRAIHPDTDAHRKFIAQRTKEGERIKKLLPWLV